MTGSPTLGGGAGADGDAALSRELEGVGEEIFQDLLQALRIRRDHSREIAQELDIEREALGVGNVPEVALHRIAQRRHADLLGLDRDRARLDLGQIQDIREEVQEIRAGGVDIAGVLHLLARQILVPVRRQLLAKDEDRIEVCVRSSCDMLARNLDLYFEVSATLGLAPLLERTTGLLDLAVLACSGPRRFVPPAGGLSGREGLRWSAAALFAVSATRRSAAATAAAGLRSSSWLQCGAGARRRWTRVSCSRNAIRVTLKGWSDASSITALAWPRTAPAARRCWPVKRRRDLPSSTVVVIAGDLGQQDTMLLSTAHCPTSPCPAGMIAGRACHAVANPQAIRN